MSLRILAVRLGGEEDVVVARQTAREVARELGFDGQDQIRIATTVSELARNAVSYAREGRVEFVLEQGDDARALAVHVTDKGPGIGDLDAVLAGRYRSSTGMGMGILGARRLMDRFEIETGAQGTSVLVAKRLPRNAPRVAEAALAAIADRIARTRPGSAHELRQQNAELMQAMQELQARTEELEQLTAELENTNRGVVALHGELEATAAELRRTSDLKTRFLSNISHEFRTPLNSILGLSRLLLDRTDGTLSDEQDRQLRYITAAATGLGDLVNDLLDIAKVEAGKVDVTPTRFSVMDLFGALRGLLRPLRTSERVELVFEEPSGVPLMVSDEGKITQILRNFIANALKYTTDGEVRVSVQFVAPDRMLFCVRDTGIGIAKEHHDRIFEEFEQVPHPLQARSKGTGLGLPLSRRLAALLKGRVAVDSEPGRGSSFFLEVPVDLTEVAADAEVKSAARTDARPRVLIADDEEAFRYVMRRMIDPARFDVVESCDGEEALELAKGLLPDVIILDLNMPKRDGYGVLDELGRFAATADIPVVVSSSLVLSQRDRARLGRSHAIMPKGTLSSETLGAVLASALEARKEPP